MEQEEKEDVAKLMLGIADRLDALWINMGTGWASQCSQYAGALQTYCAIYQERGREMVEKEKDIMIRARAYADNMNTLIGGVGRSIIRELSDEIERLRAEKDIAYQVLKAERDRLFNERNDMADEIERLWALLGQREKEIDRLQNQLIDFSKALEYSVKQN